jgi:hypothetical protein
LKPFKLLLNRLGLSLTLRRYSGIDRYSHGLPPDWSGLANLFGLPFGSISEGFGTSGPTGVDRRLAVWFFCESPIPVS